MNNLFLGDFLEKTEEEIKTHLAMYYGNGGFNYKNNEYELDCEVEEKLKSLKIIVAYENEDAYEGSSWFLFEEKETKKLFELNGGHCSCYGYEDQFKNIEETTKEYLLDQRKWYGRDEIINQFLKEHFK